MKKDKAVRKAEIKAAIVGKLKSLAVPLILTGIILIAVIVIINYKSAEEPVEVIRINAWEGGSQDLILENDQLKLVMDAGSTQFRIEVKSTGKVWYSNPLDGASDPLALTAEKGRVQSTLAMTYSTPNGTDALYNNYDYSMVNGIYDIEMGEDYIKVYYSIGDVEKQFMIPPVITAALFDEMTADMGKQNLTTLKQYYKKYDVNNLGKDDDKDALLAAYPILEQEPIYVLRDTTRDAQKQRFEMWFEELGYTEEDYARDKALDFSEASSDKKTFNINMIYRLEGNDMVVELPLREMEYTSDFLIYNVTPLPFFGAGTKEDEGFLLVPEGGGALINFNNGKLAQNSYYANMYGWDMALARDAVVHNTRAYFNVYGISSGDDSFICILEEGAPYASVQADISGRYNSYNTVNAVYSIAQREEYDVGDRSSSRVFVYLPELPDESLVLRYSFIDSGSYVDMAKEYQGYLEEKYGSYMTLNDDTEAPVAVEIVGAVDKIKQILGVPVSRPLKLTSYKEAQEIMEELKADGLNNLSVKLSGWANGGVQQKILNKAKTVSALGSKKDLQNLVNSANNLGVDLYLDGITQYAYDSTFLNGFNVFTDAARRISKEKAELHIYSDVTYTERDRTDPYYLLHADQIIEMGETLASAAESYGTGVSFRENGKDLSADYYLKGTVSRQAAMENQAAQMQEMDDRGLKIMINMGNNYAALYSDMVTNMDLRGSEYTILDTYVPFYEIALHGYVNYTGEALNLTGDTQDELLLSAEYGAGLSFTVMRETAFILQKTLYTEYFGSDYAVWHDRLVDIYTRYNAELGHTFNQRMSGHEQLSATLSCTSYEDGTKVYVNYGYTDETIDGVTVPARDYKVVR
ncbi:MAG: DUF5696 domain-containing protein [Roseburia sp.]|nr:DUF5696 domain-containing protein [Roseburia sp.]MCM1097108.1 DUF5696 domain-containing protein [Ruminococcus flavefaciens]